MELGWHQKSKQFIEQSLQRITETLAPNRPIRKDDAADLKELREYFRALEKDRLNLEQLLQETKKQNEMVIRALEREQEQKKLEWEREWEEKEVVLMDTMKSVIIRKEKLVKDVRSRANSVVVTPEPVVENRRWKWFRKVFKKRPASPKPAPAPPKDAYTIQVINESELAEIRRLEKRVREAKAKTENPG